MNATVNSNKLNWIEIVLVPVSRLIRNPIRPKTSPLTMSPKPNNFQCRKSCKRTRSSRMDQTESQNLFPRARIPLLLPDLVTVEPKRKPRDYLYIRCKPRHKSLPCCCPWRAPSPRKHDPIASKPNTRKPNRKNSNPQVVKPEKQKCRYRPLQRTTTASMPPYLQGTLQSFRKDTK